MPKVVREYRIDLGLPPEKRWAEMIRAERARAQTLIETCLDGARRNASRTVRGRWLFKLVRKLTPIVYRLSGHGYSEDLDAWSEGAGIPRADLIFANLSYELSQFAGARTRNPLRFNPLGCTAAAFELSDGSIGHVRNMDWRLTNVGPFTTVIRYDGPRGPFSTVGWPGYVSVLSGIAPGRFSATINQAPQVGAVRPNWPPSFALRRAFETCRDFEEAVEHLAATKLAAAVLYTVAGTRAGEGAVIEHAGRKAAVRRMEDGHLAVSNHYECPELVARNHEAGLDLEDSHTRLHAARKARAGNTLRRPKDMLAMLTGPRVHNEFTAQRMAFVPRTGEYYAIYEDTDAAVAAWFEGAAVAGKPEGQR